VRVPKPGSAVLEAGLIDVVLVPGVAFDRTGGRLGRGGGFYDRYLTAVAVERRVGVCFGCQVVELVPTAGHDARVGVVVSEG
jgi:5-formyltetrahydrofolate cyclo-ligase